MKRRGSERGDTLVEVLVALSVMGIAVVGTMSLMNRGVTQMYDTMERSEVRLLLDRQVESLTYARDQYIWSLSGGTLTGHDANAKDLWEDQVRTIPSVDTVPELNNCSDTSRAFVITTDTDGNLSATTTVQAVASGFPAPGDGIWMQKMHNGTVPVRYTDFYIRACWRQASSPATQVVSTVVRLYDKD